MSEPSGRYEQVEPFGFLYDIDGVPMCLLRTLAASATQALRVTFTEHDGMLFDWDVCVSLDDDGTKYRPRLSEYRALAEGTTPEWTRQADPDNEDDLGDWGKDTWWPCAEDTPGAVAVWSLPFTH